MKDTKISTGIPMPTKKAALSASERPINNDVHIVVHVDIGKDD
jgi:hypothetical protein